MKAKESRGTAGLDPKPKGRVLVVEDEAIIARDLEVLLHLHGYDVSGTADSGEESVRQAGEQCPDLVFMDINLKGRMNGVEAAHAIRERFRIPVIYLTAYAEDEMAGAANGIPRLLKPFSDRDLEAVLRHYLPKINN